MNKTEYDWMDLNMLDINRFCWFKKKPYYHIIENPDYKLSCFSLLSGSILTPLKTILVSLHLPDVSAHLGCRYISPAGVTLHPAAFTAFLSSLIHVVTPRRRGGSLSSACSPRSCTVSPCQPLVKDRR